MNNQVGGISSSGIPFLRDEVMGGTAVANFQEGTPRDPSANKARTVSINQVDRGYVVQVGCQTFAIGSLSELLGKLTEYLTDPLTTEIKWQTNKLF